MAAVSLLRGSQFSWATIFLKKFLLRHATVARRVICLQAAANFFPD
jgi:hypothetical protein